MGKRRRRGCKTQKQEDYPEDPPNPQTCPPNWTPLLIVFMWAAIAWLFFGSYVSKNWISFGSENKVQLTEMGQQKFDALQKERANLQSQLAEYASPFIPYTSEEKKEASKRANLEREISEIDKRIEAVKKNYQQGDYDEPQSTRKFIRCKYCGSTDCPTIREARRKEAVRQRSYDKRREYH